MSRSFLGMIGHVSYLFSLGQGRQRNPGISLIVVKHELVNCQVELFSASMLSQLGGEAISYAVLFSLGEAHLRETTLVREANSYRLMSRPELRLQDKQVEVFQSFKTKDGCTNILVYS